MLPQVAITLSVLSSASAFANPMLVVDRSLMKRGLSEKCILRPQPGDTEPPQIISKTDFFKIYAAKMKVVSASAKEQNTTGGEEKKESSPTVVSSTSSSAVSSVSKPSPEAPPQKESLAESSPASPAAPRPSSSAPVAAPAPTSPAQSNPPPSNPPPPSGGDSFGSGDASWMSECLSRHNGFRSEIPVPNLSWDSDLAARAKERAEVNANLGRLVHDNNGNGENLYVTWGGDKACAAAVGAWHDEKSLFPAGATFGVGDPSDYGHYTQVCLFV